MPLSFFLSLCLSFCLSHWPSLPLYDSHCPDLLLSLSLSVPLGHRDTTGSLCLSLYLSVCMMDTLINRMWGREYTGLIQTVSLYLYASLYVSLSLSLYLSHCMMDTLINGSWGREYTGLLQTVSLYLCTSLNVSLSLSLYLSHCMMDTLINGSWGREYTGLLQTRI